MASLNAWAEKKKYILLNNLGNKHTVNEIWPVYVILIKKKNYQKILQKLQPENFFKSACRPPQIHFLRGFFAN